MFQVWNDQVKSFFMVDIYMRVKASQEELEEMGISDNLSGKTVTCNAEEHASEDEEGSALLVNYGDKAYMIYERFLEVIVVE
jgi:hypothetical protein